MMRTPTKSEDSEQKKLDSGNGNKEDDLSRKSESLGDDRSSLAMSQDSLSSNGAEGCGKGPAECKIPTKPETENKKQKAEAVASVERNARINQHLQVLEKELGSKASPKTRNLAGLVLELAKERSDRTVRFQNENISRTADLVEGLQQDIDITLQNLNERLVRMESDKEVLRTENTLLRKSYDEMEALSERTKNEIGEMKASLETL